LNLLTQKMNYYLDEYNLKSQTQMSLVMFQFAIEHISRISRILQQDNGHVLMVGIGGSGRHSCARLAASMMDFMLFQVSLHQKFLSIGLMVFHSSVCYKNVL
jgi:dynein heavy chain